MRDSTLLNLIYLNVAMKFMYIVQFIEVRLKFRI